MSNTGSTSSQQNKPKLVLPTEWDIYTGKFLRAHPTLHHELRDKYFEAADRSDLKTVGFCLHSGISINAYDMVGRTIFHIAAGNGALSLVLYVIQWPGIDLNLQTFDYMHTPLHEAVTNERDEIVSVFLKAGARVNIPNGNGSTVAHMAVEAGSETILRMLFAYKANLNVVNVFSATPLSIAILEKKDIDICYGLLRHGARVNKARLHVLYIFHEAVLNCQQIADIYLLKLLVKHGAYVNYIDEYGRNALHYAAIAGMPMLVRYLLYIGVKTAVKDKTNRTPYEIALQHEHSVAVGILAAYDKAHAS